jgi:uncharacterized GH25 family protein
MTMMYKNQIAALALYLVLAPALAHDFWIEPDEFTPAAEQVVSVSLREGVGFKGNTLPYIKTWFTDFSVTDSSGRDNVESIQGNDPAAEIVASSGAQLLGYQSQPSFVELEADKFNKYLEDEGIEFIQAERERRGESQSPAPEYFVRCAKALLQTGPINDDVYKSKLGYTLELIPQSNPYALNENDELVFQLIYDDAPIKDRLVQAFNKSAPDVIQKVRTDGNGMATVKIDRAGIWLVKAVQIIPIKDRPQTDVGAPPAQWQSYWASYLFEMQTADQSR